VSGAHTFHCGLTAVEGGGIKLGNVLQAVPHRHCRCNAPGGVGGDWDVSGLRFGFDRKLQARSIEMDIKFHEEIRLA